MWQTIYETSLGFIVSSSSNRKVSAAERSSTKLNKQFVIQTTTPQYGNNTEGKELSQNVFPQTFPEICVSECVSVCARASFPTQNRRMFSLGWLTSSSSFQQNEISSRVTVAEKKRERKLSKYRHWIDSSSKRFFPHSPMFRAWREKRWHETDKDKQKESRKRHADLLTNELSLPVGGFTVGF